MTSKKYDFSGKVALITGSSSGIGAAIARQFAQCNAKVVITGFEGDEVEQMAQEIEKISGKKPFYLAGSLLDEGFPERLVEGTLNAYGQIDILVNNAGRGIEGDSVLQPDFMNKYEKLMDLNVKSVLKMTHLCVPHLEKTKGNIINTASIASFVPLPQMQATLYCASKAAVAMITKCVAIDLGPKGIRVNSINPGVIRTNLGRSIGNPDALLGETPFDAHTIMNRLGNPAEVANVVLFLASDQASYITGSCYLVDGGYLCL